MQAISVYLYPNMVDVFTNVSAAWQPERYRKVYNRNLKIYRSVDNRIDLQVRNSDQKATDISNSTLVFNLITRDTKDLVLSKDCDAVNTASGRCFVTLTETDLADINNGFYNYSITQEVRSTIDSTDYTVSSRSPTYIDSQYGVIGVLEIAGDPLGESAESLEVNKFEYVNPASTGSLNARYYTSSHIDTIGHTQTPQSLHTFQFYSTAYSGTIIIQGSLSEGGTPNVWTDIATYSVTNSNVSYANVVGKFNFLRIRHYPTAGTVDKILYR